MLLLVGDHLGTSLSLWFTIKKKRKKELGLFSPVTACRSVCFDYIMQSGFFDSFHLTWTSESPVIFFYKSFPFKNIWLIRGKKPMSDTKIKRSLNPPNLNGFSRDLWLIRENLHNNIFSLLIYIYMLVCLMCCHWSVTTWPYSFNIQYKASTHSFFQLPMAEGVLCMLSLCFGEQNTYQWFPTGFHNVLNTVKSQRGASHYSTDHIRPPHKSCCMVKVSFIDLMVNLVL